MTRGGVRSDPCLVDAGGAPVWRIELDTQHKWINGLMGKFMCHWESQCTILVHAPYRHHLSAVRCIVSFPLYYHDVAAAPSARLLIVACLCPSRQERQIWSSVAGARMLGAL